MRPPGIAALVRAVSLRGGNSIAIRIKSTRPIRRILNNSPLIDAIGSGICGDGAGDDVFLTANQIPGSLKGIDLRNEVAIP